MRKAGKKDKVSVIVRLPRVVREGLRKIAAREHRSINEQIVHVVARWLEQQPDR